MQKSFFKVDHSYLTGPTVDTRPIRQVGVTIVHIKFTVIESMIDEKIQYFDQFMESTQWSFPKGYIKGFS